MVLIWSRQTGRVDTSQLMITFQAVYTTSAPSPHLRHTQTCTHRALQHCTSETNRMCNSHLCTLYKNVGRYQRGSAPSRRVRLTFDHRLCSDNSLARDVASFHSHFALNWRQSTHSTIQNHIAKHKQQDTDKAGSPVQLCKGGHEIESTTHTSACPKRTHP